MFGANNQGMAQRRHHYEAAFEELLRARRIPYVAVDEARKALLPSGVEFKGTSAGVTASADDALKCFDFVVYGGAGNLLVDIKGRKVARRAANRAAAPAPRSSLQSWVTQDDVWSISRWRSLFGAGFDAAFVFVYWCEDQPPDGLFQDVFEHRGRWYAVRSVQLDRYTASMKTRSAKWRTVHVPVREFERISGPFVGA